MGRRYVVLPSLLFVLDACTEPWILSAVGLPPLFFPIG